MPRRPNKTDYGMLDADPDVEAFYRDQMNKEFDEFEIKAKKRWEELSPALRMFLGLFGLSGEDFFTIYEQGWNDGHSQGIQEGKETIWFYQGRDKKKESK